MTEHKTRNDFEHISEPVRRVIESIPKPKVPDDAPKAHPQLGEPSEHHVYTDENGTALVTVYRYDNSDNSDNSDKSPPKKEFRPFCHYCQKWHAPKSRPLYRLDALAKFDGPVVLVEGEKCADALNEIGVLSVTAFGGCNGVAKTDMSPLRGRDVIIWPDYDEAGDKYAHAVAYSLAKVGAHSVACVSLAKGTETDFALAKGMSPDHPLRNANALAKGWDAADALNQDGFKATHVLELINTALPFKAMVPLNEPQTGERSRIDIFAEPLQQNPLTLTGTPRGLNPVNGNEGAHHQSGFPVNVTEDWPDPDMSVLNPRRTPPEFPVQLFGPFWSKWVLAKAEGCSAPVDYVGMSLLSLLSGLIGCSRFVSPWGEWSEPPILWVALVGNPSSGKSPALESVLGIARKIEQDGAHAVKDELRQYEAELLSAQCLRQDWEKQVKEATKSGHPVPPLPENAQEPTKPERPRIMASDTTPEALARLLACQPKGLLITRDELAGWLGSFNRYSGGQGGDRAFWLEAYGGRPYVIDRARNGGEAVTVPNLSASIIGGIQPDKLQSLLLSGDDDGLTARILFCWPAPVPLERPQRVPESHEAETALRWLNGLSLIPDGTGGLSHGVVVLSDEAADLFQAWRKEHGANQPEGAIASWWGKMPGVCLRLALCFEYLWLSSTTRQESFSVSYAAIEAATVMIEQYLKPMAERAYGDAALSKAERDAAALAKWIVKNEPKLINVREIQRMSGIPSLKKVDEVKGAVAVLLDGDWLRADPRRNGTTAGKRSGDYRVNIQGVINEIRGLNVKGNK
ncbi:DUF3987 domain-containing protein [Pseudomonadota bacterium]